MIMILYCECWYFLKVGQTLSYTTWTFSKCIMYILKSLCKLFFVICKIWDKIYKNLKRTKLEVFERASHGLKHAGLALLSRAQYLVLEVRHILYHYPRLAHSNWDSLHVPRNEEPCLTRKQEEPHFDNLHLYNVKKKSRQNARERMFWAGTFFYSFKRFSFRYWSGHFREIYDAWCII